MQSDFSAPSPRRLTLRRVSSRVALLFSVLLTQLMQPVPAVTAAVPNQDSYSLYVGLDGNSLPEAEQVAILDQARATGADWARINVGWEDISKAPGTYDF